MVVNINHFFSKFKLLISLSFEKYENIIMSIRVHITDRLVDIASN